MKRKRRFYQGDPAKQPKDCGRPHPQEICLCMVCEVYARFQRIEDLEKELARIRRLNAALKKEDGDA